MTVRIRHLSRKHLLDIEKITHANSMWLTFVYISIQISISYARTRRRFSERFVMNSNICRNQCKWKWRIEHLTIPVEYASCVRLPLYYTLCLCLTSLPQQNIDSFCVSSFTYACPQQAKICEIFSTISTAVSTGFWASMPNCHQCARYS